MAHVPEFSTDGWYTLQSVNVYDKAGNSALHSRGGSVSVAPSGATGPSSHTIDFEAADFYVSQDGSPPPSPTPSPTATPTPTPSATEAPTQDVHVLAVTMTLRKGNRRGYIIPSGVVTIDDGFVVCYETAIIYIQRRVDGIWKTQRWGDAVDKETGAFKLPVRAMRGKYRAKIKPYELNAEHYCSGALSPVRTWR